MTPGPKTFDQSVGASDQTESDFNGLRFLQVQAYQSSATVKNVDFRIEQVGSRRPGDGSFTLDAQNLRPQGGQQHGPHRSRPQRREFNHLDAMQRPHLFSSY